MQAATYQKRRSEIETYFDRTAMAAWAKLTSTAPVSGIRATVRAGRDKMRNTLLSWLPEDMSGMRLLDAGCGTGALALEAARAAPRSSPSISLRNWSPLPPNAPRRSCAARIRFHAGDMLDPGIRAFRLRRLHGFDHPLPRRRSPAQLRSLQPGQIGPCCSPSRRARRCWAPALPSAKYFPRGDRSPAIVPQSEKRLRQSFKITAHGAKNFRVLHQPGDGAADMLTPDKLINPTGRVLKFWRNAGRAFLPFADVITEELPCREADRAWRCSSSPSASRQHSSSAR
jgi:magnesium-protoporphyrin O-methyltransferase